MRNYSRFYIDGAWVAPSNDLRLDVINPATEGVAGSISMGGKEDIDHAARAARGAFEAWSNTSREERLAVLERLASEYEKRLPDLAEAITEEMGAPNWLAEGVQAPVGLWHLQTAIGVLGSFEFEEQRGTTKIVKEPIGVCGFITPWNWPLNQIVTKVAPALATGCTMVLKPSEIAPFSAQIFAEIVDAADVPAGVFNLVFGDGPTAGAALSAHPEVDMVSFTGSTRAGVEVARAAAPTVKRVHQELGGKSPNIILDDDGFQEAVAAGVSAVMMNTGQSCNAPTRMLVPNGRMKDAIEAAVAAVGTFKVGSHEGPSGLGPVVSQAQYDKIQALIEKGLQEGASLVSGGAGRPEGMENGYYVRPTVFAEVSNEMTIAREEIFGPVLAIIGYDDIDEAIRIANDTDYGLAAYISGKSDSEVKKIAAQVRAGQVNINGAPLDMMAPFGGYRMSGNGREWGDHAFSEFLETKAVLGYLKTA